MAAVCEPLKPIEISSPGVNVDCVIGIRQLYETTDRLRGFPGALSPTPTITSTEPKLTVSAIAPNTATVRIGTREYKPGQALYFVLTCASGLAAGDYTLQLASIRSAAGYQSTGAKAVRVRTPAA